MRRLTVREVPVRQPTSGWQVQPVQEIADRRQGAARIQHPTDITLVLDPGQKAAGQRAAATPAQQDVRQPAQKPAKKAGGYVGKHCK